MEIIREIDFIILDYIREHLRNGFFDNVMPIITTFGNLGIFWVVVALIISAKKKYRRCSVTMMIGMIIGVVLGNFIVKNIVRRERPCWINEIGDMLIAIPQDYSFPSGHTLSSFISATILTYYDKRFAVPSFSVAILIAFSRMYLYVHFPTDIMGGAVLGVGIAIMTISLSNKYIFDKNKNKTV